MRKNKIDRQEATELTEVLDLTKIFLAILASWRSKKFVNILDEIVEQKKREVAQLPARLIAAGDLRDAMLEHGERRDFIAALKNPHVGKIGLIAEVKKASPSAGVIFAKTLIQSALRRNTKRRAQAAFPF